MSLIELYPTFYCLYIKDHKGEERAFLPQGLFEKSKLRRLDLFENKEILYSWINEEQKAYAQAELWNTHAIYGRLYSKKIALQEVLELMQENSSIDSVTVVNKNGLRRLYFRYELENNYDLLLLDNYKIDPKESIYIINRQKNLDDKVILQKESYFVTYPEVATPLFTLDIREWAEDLISRKENQGYYIEQTTLYDVYKRTNLGSKNLNLFILTREEAPHYILRQNNLKFIIENMSDY